MSEQPMLPPPKPGSRPKPLPRAVPMEPPTFPVVEEDEPETFPTVEVSAPQVITQSPFVTAARPSFRYPSGESGGFSLLAWAGIFAALIGAGFVILVVVAANNPTPIQSEDEAIELARVHVLSWISNPRDAEFLYGATCSRFPMPQMGGATCFSVKGLVKVMNGFGAKLTREYSAKLFRVKGELRCAVVMLEDEVIYADEELIKQFKPQP